MLVKFLPHTGARNLKAGITKPDTDARGAVRYLLADIVLKPVDHTGERKPVRRARPPVRLSGDEKRLRQLCANLTFKHRYASGVIAFAKGDIAIDAFEEGDLAVRGVCDDIMQDFEDTAFAGIPQDYRPEVLWVAHTDKGRLELNFLFARAVSDGAGRVKAINPKPPGSNGNDLWSAFRDSWNARQGWDDPLDQSHHRDLKLPDNVLANPRRNIEGGREYEDAESISFDIGSAVDYGLVACRDDAIAWLQGQDYRINRIGKDYISVCPSLRRTSSQMGPFTYGKPIRLRGDLFDIRFTSLEWLTECGYKDGGLPPARRDMSGAEAQLARLRTARARHHQIRLGWPDDDVMDPAAEITDDTVISDGASTEAEMDGLVCAWRKPARPPSPPLAPKALIAPPDDLSGGPFESASSHADEKVADDPQEAMRTRIRRLIWQDLYHRGVISDELAGKLRYVDGRTRTVWLQDGSSIRDTGARLTVRERTHDTLRLMFAQATAKGWSRISVRGDEEFLREAARYAVAQGIEIAGRNDAMDAVVQDEVGKLVQPDRAAPGYGEAFPSIPGEPDPQEAGDDRVAPEDLFDSTETRAWDGIYGPDTLPADLRPKLSRVDATRRRFQLADGSTVLDHEFRIEICAATEDTVRLVIAQARAKGWSGLNVRGDETFLRAATRVAIKEGFPLEGRDAEMADIIADETAIVWDQVAEPTPDDDDLSMGPS
ncbi:LPD7 domain-containing protein [Paracoccus sp. Ld10]|uniref:LPD7 domain-containing protein n=1 Tax=Paracoccus sp. Ld10 TaxID=649158 RepID=UPI00386EA057